MISISRNRRQIMLENRGATGELLQAAFSTAVSLKAPPGRYIPFDHESDLEFIRPCVRAALISALPLRMPTISITSLTERAAPHYVLYSAATQQRLKRQVGQAAREVSDSEPSIFEYHPTLSNHEAFIRFLHSPEENDPRGRTQGYQRLARSAQRPRRQRPEIPGQGSLLDELDKADSNEGDET
jgi:hypothetical protein